MAKIFDPDTLHAIARKGVNLPFREMVRTVSDELALAYPGHIEPREDWFYSFAAGIKGSMTVLHASLTEYIVIFGSALPTGGFSGRYPIEIHDFMMSGEMWTCTDDNVGERIVTPPGEGVVLRPDQTKCVHFPEGGWMLEYGRGPVPLAMPLALADALLSCGDFHTVFKTFRVYGRLTVRELLKGKL